jgi:H+-transporting ATPase
MDVLLVDKTGTLTKNQPEIAQLLTFDGATEAQLLTLAAAATDRTAADTISTAITRAYDRLGKPPPRRLSFTGFDPVRKVATALIPASVDDGANVDTVTVVLGSPVILGSIADTPADFTQQVDVLSARGSRVLAVASGSAGRPTCRGLIALADSPRDDARRSLEKIRDRGIRIIMITGDAVGTAKAIAEQVGIGDRIGALRDAQTHPLDFDGFANVYPEDKYTAVRALQQAGSVVGMTGDGINDAPALKQADVGIAVSSATDVAKSAARIVLTQETLSDITSVIDSGHRVYRRMMTWTITKLARTAELAALLTFGFILAGFFPVSLTLIVLIVIMNDLVTLTLGTDRAQPTSIAEKWDMPRLDQISAIFTVGWLTVGLTLLLFYLDVQALDPDRISSLMFVYLIYSAMATILMTRTREPFWTFASSKWVAGMVAINCLAATPLAASGWVMAALPWTSIITLLGITAASMLVLDALKVAYYKRTRILAPPTARA